MLFCAYTFFIDALENELRIFPGKVKLIKSAKFCVTLQEMSLFEHLDADASR